MTKPKKTRARSKNGTPPSAIIVPPQRELKAFYEGGGQTPDFGFARFYWPLGGGQRESILPHLTKKRQPAAAEAQSDTAARVEALPTRDAHQDYADPGFMMRRYEETLPDDEVTAFAQVTLRFGSEVANLHYPYEVGRQWLREFYVEARGVPVIAILHAPYLVGSNNPAHLHGIILPRRLGKFSWLSVERDLASDLGHREAFASWSAFKAGRL